MPAKTPPRVPRRRGRSQRYTSHEFRPYVSALGRLTLAWNDLQESLAGLYWTLNLPGPPSAGDSFTYAPLKVWAAVKSDRTQRDMLRAVVNQDADNWGRPALEADALWLLKEAGKLADARNDAVHSPLYEVDKSLYGMGNTPGVKVAPAWWLSNPRALNLSKHTDLLAEFRYCHDTAIVLSDYGQALNNALVNRGQPWPRRPTMPTRSAQP